GASLPHGASSLARNSLINVLGQLAPGAIAGAAGPPLLNGLGGARFGVLPLAWAAGGWFSVFDLGLGRATTHVVATEGPTTDKGHTRNIVLLIIAGLFVVGCAAGLVAAFTTPYLI